MEAKLANSHSTLTAPNYRVGNFKFLYLSFLKNYEKIIKMSSHLKKKKRFEMSRLGKNAIPQITLTAPNYRAGYFKFAKLFFLSKFSETL